MYRLATSYPQLPVFHSRQFSVERVLEVGKVARKGSRRVPNRRPMSLKELHRRVLKRCGPPPRARVVRPRPTLARREPFAIIMNMF